MNLVFGDLLGWGLLRHPAAYSSGLHVRVKSILLHSHRANRVVHHILGRWAFAPSRHNIDRWAWPCHVDRSIVNWGLDAWLDLGHKPYLAYFDADIAVHRRTDFHYTALD